MNDKNRIIYYKDREDEKVSESLKKIESGNAYLYRLIMQKLKSDSAIGIREDVLGYICSDAESLGNDQTKLLQIANMVSNTKISVEHIKWAIDYLSKDTTSLSVDDFAITFIEAVEKDIPLAGIAKIYGSEADVVSVYKQIEAYDFSENDEADSIPENNVVKDMTVVDRPYDNDGQHVPGYAEMFDSLITVMKPNESDDTVKQVNENLNKIIVKFQGCVSELQTYSSEVVHEVEKDKDEIKRMTALLNLQRKIMEGQQTKINEMRNEIARLNNRIQMAEKKELHREAINQKISELQNLTFNEQKENSELYSPF